MADFSEIKSDSKSRMDKTIETLRGDFGSLRAGRAHVSLLDGIMVEAYGSMTPLSQVEIGRASCRKECRSRWSPYH